jgi:ketosteroid isomerase-like protein
MNKITIESTLNAFLKGWEEKDIEAVVNLLSDSFAYYESPLDLPLTTKDQVRTLWAPVPKFEATVTLSFETLSIEDSFGLFRITGTYEHTYDKTKKITRIDRIFLLSVDTDGKLTKFMQWRESKDN